MWAGYLSPKGRQFRVGRWFLQACQSQAGLSEVKVPLEYLLVSLQRGFEPCLVGVQRCCPPRPESAAKGFPESSEPVLVAFWKCFEGVLGCLLIELLWDLVGLVGVIN